MQKIKLLVIADTHNTLKEEELINTLSMHPNFDLCILLNTECGDASYERSLSCCFCEKRVFEIGKMRNSSQKAKKASKRGRSFMKNSYLRGILFCSILYIGKEPPL